MKVTGAEFMDWYDNHWLGNDWYHDDNEIETHGDDGEWLLQPEEVYDTADLGCVCYQGEDHKFEGTVYDVAKLLKLYRRNRDFDLLTLEVPKSKTQLIKEILTTHGVKFR